MTPSSPSRWGWAFLLLAVLVGGGLRFWLLAQAPAGLYRDEAFNGLDALAVLEGDHALFFPANNGREPLYIYLTALAISLWGRSLLAVRLTAAVVGTLTIITTWLLAQEWFGWRVGVLAAWLWAITLWPVHLSRIGLRPILLIPLLSLAFWVGTRAYRQQTTNWWLLAGLLYGLTFYSYLAARLTPVLLIGVALYLLWRGQGKKLWPGGGWFVVATAVTVLPLIFAISQQPDGLLGRTGQVSILNQAVNEGNLLATIWQQTMAALGMFLWQGDTILRHNPAGRPVFDLLLTTPFLLGLFVCLRRWQRPVYSLTLLWTGVMLAGTILAEDAPHFLRAVGVLPAVLFLPALGLDWIQRELAASPKQWVGTGLTAVLLVASLGITVYDYQMYLQDDETGYLFEAAVTEMAEQMETAVVAGEQIFVDARYGEGWPSLPFLAGAWPVQRFAPDEAWGVPVTEKATIFAWPYGTVDFLPQAIVPPGQLTIAPGAFARGDLEPEPYQLYVKYKWQPGPQTLPVVAEFGDQWQLRQVAMDYQTGGRQLVVDLSWSTKTAVAPPVTAFVHVVDADGVVAQSDGPIGQSNWQHAWWHPGLVVRETRVIDVGATGFDPIRHTIHIGLYDPATIVRLPAVAGDGVPLGDAWIWRVEPE